MTSGETLLRSKFGIHLSRKFEGAGLQRGCLSPDCARSRRWILARNLPFPMGKLGGGLPLASMPPNDGFAPLAAGGLGAESGRSGRPHSTQS
jgi:hypothetical protein